MTVQWAWRATEGIRLLVGHTCLAVVMAYPLCFMSQTVNTFLK